MIFMQCSNVPCIYDMFRVAFFRASPATPVHPRPITPQAALGHALATKDAQQSRALGRFLSRLLYTREIFLARLHNIPVASRPDNLACTLAASISRIDETSRALSNACVTAWWRRSLPPPCVLVPPESGIVTLNLIPSSAALGPAPPVQSFPDSRHRAPFPRFSHASSRVTCPH